MFQMKEQDKNPEVNSSETEISNLPDKKFKVMVINMLTELGTRIEEHSGKFSRVRIYEI